MAEAQVRQDRPPEEELVEVKNRQLEQYVQELASETLSAEELLGWASRVFPGRAVINTSFQYTGTAMIHMACTLGLDLRFATIDTLRLQPETYAFIREIEARYGCAVEVIRPKEEMVERMVERFGEYLFFDSQEKQEYCCQVRKVRPNNELLKSVDCWITGLRKDQSAHRQETASKVDLVPEYGTRRKILKLSPLADWSEERLLQYVEKNDVPSHPLYGQGYPSFGCIICSTPTRSGEPKRAGRWRWFNENSQSVEGGDHKECGLHYNI